MAHFSRLLRHTPNWNGLRAIGNSPVVKLSALFPFIGYLLTFSELVSKHIAPLGGYLGSYTDPLWSLKILYIGLFFIGLASIIYVLLCPDTVKRYGSPNEYFIGEKYFYTTNGNLKRLLSLPNIPKNIRDKLDFFIYNNADVDENQANSLADLMNYHYEIINKSGLYFRFTVTTLYTIGFLLSFLPGLRTFWNVATSLFRI